MPFYKDLPAINPRTGRINAVVDTPMGSRGKYKYDDTSGLFLLSKLLPLGAYFPYNFGFVPQTRGPDGDALDILMIMDEPVALGCVVPLRLIGVLMAEQTESDGQVLRNDRLLGVLETQYNPPALTDISAMPAHQLDEIEHFFISYNAMEGRRFTPVGRDGVAAARALIDIQPGG